MATIRDDRQPSAAVGAPDGSIPRDGPLHVARAEGSPPALRISGAVDLNSHDDWSLALQNTVLTGQVLHLDLTELAFIDMRGVSLLVEAARRLPDGARIVINGPPPCMRRMMAVLWPEGVDAITINGDTS
jgi:anti-anti-sigma regulatory factor